MMKLGRREWFTEARERKGFTKTRLAELIEVGKSHITGIENGEKNPSGPVALKLSRVLEVSMEKFFEDQI